MLKGDIITSRIRQAVIKSPQNRALEPCRPDGGAHPRPPCAMMRPVIRIDAFAQVKEETMKKKLTAMICALALAMAMPTLAWASNSPQKVTSNTCTASQGATLTVSGKTDDSTSKLVVEATSDQASNVSLSATQKIVGTFKVYDVPEGSTYGPYTLTFNVGTEYNGATATVFIEHQGRDANLGTETKTATVSNGNVTISTDGLSLVTIAVDSSTVTGATTDASATSPQTGVDMTGIAVATAACAIAAVGVGVVLRKKLAE